MIHTARRKKSSAEESRLAAELETLADIHCTQRKFAACATNTQKLCSCVRSWCPRTTTASCARCTGLRNLISKIRSTNLRKPKCEERSTPEEVRKIHDEGVRIMSITMPYALKQMQAMYQRAPDQTHGSPFRHMH